MKRLLLFKSEIVMFFPTTHAFLSHENNNSNQNTFFKHRNKHHVVCHFTQSNLEQISQQELKHGETVRAVRSALLPLHFIVDISHD